MELDEANISKMTDSLMEVAVAKYETYENIEGKKIIDIHVFMNWVKEWADMGLGHEVDMAIKLLDMMTMANVMLGRLEFPTIVREGSGIRYAALKVDIYKRLERSKNRKASPAGKQIAGKMIDSLMSKILNVGSY